VDVGGLAASRVGVEVSAIVLDVSPEALARANDVKTTRIGERDLRPAFARMAAT
jgi:hypothetical protein